MLHERWRTAGEGLEPFVNSDDAPRLDVRVLGAVQLLHAGAPVVLGGPKQRGVLAMLVLSEGHPVSVSRLIDGIWGPDPPSGARGVIHSYVAELRRLLGPPWRAVLQTVGDGYSLELPTDSTDLERFLRLVDRARCELRDGHPRAARQLLTKAVAECRGDPLTDLADLSFAGPAQQRLTELVMNAREEALEIDLALGVVGDASAELRRLTAEQPYRERLWELLALALYRHGRQVEALDAIGQARRLLRDEVGIDPNPRLTQIELAILRQESTDRFLAAHPPVDLIGATAPTLEKQAANHRVDAPSPTLRPSVRHRQRTIVFVGTLVVVAGLLFAIVFLGGAGVPRTVAAGDVGVVDARSGELLATIPLGRSIAGIASGGDHVFATDPSGRVLVQIDPRERTIMRSFALDGEPWRPTISGSDVFVPIGAGQVARLDPLTGLVDQPLEPVGSNPGRVVVIGVGERSWAVAMNGVVRALDATGIGGTDITLPVRLNRVAGDDDRAWAVTDETVVELVSFSPAELLTRAPLRGTGVDIAVGLSSVWIVTSEDNRLWRADPYTGEVLGTLALPATPTGVVAANDAVWVSTAPGQLLAIDPAGEAITRTVDFDHPIVALTYGHSTLWVGFA